jgi:peptidoglycan hydrolase-like protein with peptidoglycan-binding domain
VGDAKGDNMTTQHKAIVASAVLALLGAGTAYAQDTQTSHPSTAKPAAQEKANADTKTQAARSVQAAKPKAVTLTNAERTLLQQRLHDEGFYHGKVDGKMDDATTRAIAAYQKKHGLVATGRPNSATLSSMGIMASRGEPAVASAPHSESKPAPATTARAENDGVVFPNNKPIKQGQSEAVSLDNLTIAETRAIQEKLRRLGFYQGEIDGRAGASTQRALSDYYHSQAELAEAGKVRSDSASTFDEREDIQRVRGEEKATKKNAKPSAAKTDARTMERGLDNSPQSNTETGPKQ